MANNNLDINSMMQKLQQLQKQADQFNQMQNTVNQSTQTSAPVATTYPKVVRSDTVEDILSNPQWRQELEAEFPTSELGKRAKYNADVFFMEFCENQTGKPSTMLDGLRKEAKAKEKPTAPKAKKSAEPAESEGGTKE